MFRETFLDIAVGLLVLVACCAFFFIGLVVGLVIAP